MDWTAALPLGGIILLGASVQRLAGMGFALVAAPALVLLLGPAEGVALANCCSGVVSAIALATAWREVRPGLMAPLIVASGCAVPAGTWVAGRLPAPQLLVAMGVLVTVAVLLVMYGARIPSLRGRGGAIAAGAVSGFMNSSAGVGGPALSLYAVNAGWPVSSFVPNAQLFAVAVNIFSVAANGLPSLSTPGWLLGAAGIAGGAVIGKELAERVREEPVRRIILVLALVGGVTTLVKGAVGF